MRKRIWAWIMTFMMVISMMPTSAFAGINNTKEQTDSGQTAAAAQTSAVQIGDYYEVSDTTGALPESPTLKEGSTEQSCYADGKVKVNKTIEKTNEENVFDITLTVKTQEELKESTEDAAVVLVIDDSGSMNTCINCGHEHKKGQNKCGYELGNRKCDCENNVTRSSAIKAAANAFIESFASTNSNVTRKIAVVKFSGLNDRDYGYLTAAKTIVGWTGINSDNKSTVENTIANNLEANGGTDIEAGLILARNLLAIDNNATDNKVLVNSVTNKPITNKNLILLTDGKPTYGISGDNTSYTSIEEIGKDGRNIVGNGSATTCDTNDERWDNTPDTHKDAEELARYIKEDMGVSTYGIYVGDQKVKCNNCDLDTDGEGWLSANCGFTAYAANDISGLTDLFKNLANLIALKAQAWIVTDPMGENVKFESITPDATHNPSSTYGFKDGKITWDIKSGCLPVKSETTGTGENKVTTYTYQLSYKVRLDTLAEDFEFSNDTNSHWYATNDVTGLTYLITEGDEVPTKVDTAYFNVPSVRGFAAGLDFDKVDSSESALSGAEFTLKHDADCSCGEKSSNWSRTVTSDENGDVSFADIPSGHTYTLTETSAPDGYKNNNTTYKVKVSYGEITITDGKGNTVTPTAFQVVNEPEVVDIEGTKDWNDNNNQDGKRVNVTVELYANGDKVTDADGNAVTATATKDNGWKWVFTNLPKYKGGQEISYTIKEVNVPDGYTASNDGVGNAENNYTITNTHTPEKISINGTKTWNDNENQDGKRPADITINLFADGVQIDSTTTTSTNNWNWSFTGLDKYKDGEEIVYTVTETTVDGYTSEIEANTDGTGFIITNTHAPEKTSVAGTKTWVDGNNQDGKRPSEITVNLFANGKKIDSKEVKADEKGIWSYSFTDLPKYENGKEITYTVTEDAITGYTTAISGYNITNTHVPETTGISGTKTWDDNNNQDGLRPGSITVKLMADGVQAKTADGNDITATVNGDSNWSYSFTNLPVYKDGNKIKYTVDEEAVEGYTATITQTTNGYNITNTHTPGKTSVAVTKVWTDGNNQDGKRPDSVEVKLFADGNDTGKSVTLNADNGWKGTFTDLAQKADGKDITYTVKEVQTDTLKEYYKVEITGNAAEGFTLTNTHEPEITSISGTKTWDDADNQDGKRPSEITIKLMKGTGDEAVKVAEKTVKADKDGKWSYEFTNLPVYENGTKIEYTVVESTVPDGYEAEVDGYDITNTHTPETTSISGTKTWVDADNQDDKRPSEITVKLMKGTGDSKTQVAEKTVKADKDGNWSYEFKDLPVYENGNKIVYTVTEDAVKDYTTKVDGYNITNTHEPEQVNIPVTKTWDDADNQDGVRPGEIKVTLYADGEATDKTLTLNADNNWKGSFTGLDKYKEGEVGQPIEYTVKESEIDGYEADVSGNITDGFTITNTHTPETTSISGTKTWNDDGNRDGKRPKNITVNLLADGQTALDKDGNAITKTVEADKDGNWSYSFTDLPKKANGENITYTVSETAVENYSTAYYGNNIINSYTPAKTSITVTKAWDDVDNQDGIRPDSITVKLYTKSSTTPVASLVLNEENNWRGTFTDLNVNSIVNGVSSPIEYYVVEETIKDYTSTQSGDLVNGIVITNTHTPETVSVDGTKTWDDNDNRDGKRPESITVNLLADGQPATDADGNVITATATADNNWSYSFADLPKFKDEGKTIKYTVEENAVDGYEATVDGYNITNIHELEKVDISGTKIWEDGDNQDGKRPESITVNLFADGQPAVDKDGNAITATVKADKDGNWSWTFDNLPKYKEGEVGQEIVYTVTEDAVKDYTTKVDGYNIINTHEVEKTAISVAKVWADDDNRDNIRPDDITVSLLANGSDTGKTVKLNKENGWKTSFDNLDKNSGGEAIKYTVIESGLPDGYNSTVTGDMAIGFTITNSHSYATVEIGGTKTWNDGDNQDGVRPDKITVRLYADGTEVNSQTVAGTDSTWSYSFSTDKEGKYLPKYNKGEEIKYTVSEDAVDGYTTAVSGYNITNTHTPSVTSLSGSKTWNDNGDQDGVRPDSIIVRLHADGTEIASRTVTAASGWSWSFTNLPVNKAGTPISYTITEDAVKDYTPAINGSNITNTHSPDKTSVAVSKSWNDDNNRDGKRTSVTVALYADGASTGKTLTLSEENGWTGTFTGLDKNRDGKEISYTVKETGSPAGYTASVTGNADKGYTITNSYEPAKTSVSGSKTWNDGGDRDGKRPDAITVRLFADGEQIDQKVVDKESGWSWSFDNLYKYKDGKEINYTITEDEVAGYTTEINGYDITNTYDDFETTEVTVTKTWKGDSNGDRPDAITVELLADGEVIQTVELTAADDWAYTFKDLPAYAEGKSGVKVVYSVNEKSVEGYTTEIAGFDITNTKIPPQDDTPNTPATPDKPDKPDKPASSDNAAKTGDNMNVFALAGTAFAALAGAFAALFRRKKKA